jgi:hypothetical protein
MWGPLPRGGRELVGTVELRNWGRPSLRSAAAAVAGWSSALSLSAVISFSCTTCALWSVCSLHRLADSCIPAARKGQVVAHWLQIGSRYGARHHGWAELRARLTSMRAATKATHVIPAMSAAAIVTSQRDNAMSLAPGQGSSRRSNVVVVPKSSRGLAVPDGVREDVASLTA